MPFFLLKGYGVLSIKTTLMIQRRETLVTDVIGFMDGCTLLMECTSNDVVQNASYSGYKCDTFINNMFAYGPDGKVFMCAINCPGSWHDGSVLARLMPYICQKIGRNKICVDSGFPRTGLSGDVLVGPISR